MDKETVWDVYWKSREEISVKDTIQSDPYYRLLVRLIGTPTNKKGIKILEVGCGSGIRTSALAKRFHKNLSDVTMIDISTQALEFAKRNADINRIRANFVLADAFNLPFPGESFDVVWNEGVNEHFEGERRQLIFREMARVCKCGGEVIVIVPNALNLPYRLWKKVLELQGRWEYGFEKPYSILELRKRMRNAGVAPDKISGVGVLASLLKLTFPKNPMVGKDRNEKSSSRASNLKTLKLIFNIIERALELTCGSFSGKDIGIKGVIPLSVRNKTYKF